MSSAAVVLTSRSIKRDRVQHRYRSLYTKGSRLSESSASRNCCSLATASLMAPDCSEMNARGGICQLSPRFRETDVPAVKYSLSIASANIGISAFSKAQLRAMIRLSLPGCRPNAKPFVRHGKGSTAECCVLLKRPRCQRGDWSSRQHEIHEI